MPVYGSKEVHVRFFQHEVIQLYGSLKFFEKCSFVVIGKTLLGLGFYVFTWIFLGSSKSWIYKYTNFVHNNFFLNFAGPKLIDASGLDIPELLEAILKFFPLDTYVFNPVVLMDLVNSDKKKDMEVAIWPKYQKICDEAEGRSIVMYKEER